MPINYEPYGNKATKVAKGYHGEVQKELDRSYIIHGDFHSHHEAMGVLQEEVYELWEAIRSDDMDNMKEEALQVAAMAIKFLKHLENYE